MMLPGRRREFFKGGAASAVLLAAVAFGTAAKAQDAPVTLAQAEPAPKPAASPARPASEMSPFTDSLIPGFEFTAGVLLEETYATNASGYSGAGGQDDFITMAGLDLHLHEHSRRVSLDAQYSGQVLVYTNSGQSTQFINDLAALGNVAVIPEYVNIVGRAFAQPVVISNSGFGTASGIGGPNGFRNSYGYSVGPDITFRLSDFASSETSATYGAAYFTDPPGITSASLIPGIAGPENITQRNVIEMLKSGSDFTRLTWTAQAQFSELDRAQGLFSDKSASATLSYQVMPEFALLGTGGYDKIKNTVALAKDLSGVIAMGGFRMTSGPDFSLVAEAGRKYNGFSFLGSLRWNLSATSTITGDATDTVTTPEGQLLNNLSDLTATLGGNLVPSNNIYSNGTSSSLGSFNAQSLGGLSFNQDIVRIQMVTLGYLFDYERDHVNLQVFGQRQTRLDGIFIGSPVTNSWGVVAGYSRNISRLTTGSVNAGFINFQELGGHTTSFNLGGGVSYSLGPRTDVFFRADYYNRTSSQGLQNLSPLTGSTDDLRFSIGLHHQL